ncbi:MAG TPA: hypothetical protein VII63_05105 [Caulobacteraceae bacterium]
MVRLFHFSDDPAIKVFEPRPIRVPSERAPGRAWLNGPLVWAVEQRRQAMYLFPRDCPRILIWATETTTAMDRRRWWGDSACAMVAHMERAWLARVEAAAIHRYELPARHFEVLDDAGMWVARRAVEPTAMETITNLPAALAGEGVELRLLDDLTPLNAVWRSTVHASGVRLRNARQWDR